MDEKRKAIIINEINYWKQSRMLPDQYCDYLLALYTEGKHTNEIKNNESTRKYRIQLFLLLLFIPFSVFFIYFTEMSFVLQIAMLSFFLTLVVISTIYFAKKRINFQVLLIIASLLFLFISVEVVSRFFGNEPFYIYSILIFNCLLWFLVGKRWDFLYLKISAYLGFLLLIISKFI